MEKKGSLLLVLHAHLPYIHHPEFPDFLEEDWFFEAIAETYVPLVDLFDRLIDEGVDFRITMSITPTLASMLTDPLLQERALRYIESRIALTEKELARTHRDFIFQKLAFFYHERFHRVREVFAGRYRSNLTMAFKKYQDMGKMDILTCGATHGFFPNMEIVRASVRGQVKTAVDHYRSIFGRSPRGIWLPECGFDPGDCDILKDYGIQYFFLEAHGVLHGSPRPKYGVFAPVFCPCGIACFARDPESSKQVWSTEEGYPGDYTYREFYRDIGFDLDYDYIRPYLHSDGNRVHTGIKYYRITGPTEDKEPYQPEVARERAAEHAGNFMFNRERQAEHLFGRMGRPPVIVAPYDAELFGHWWFEGPIWLEFLIRKIAFDSQVIKMTTAWEYLKENPVNQVLTPSFSSWGWKGYSEVWLEGSNDWIYRHLHEISRRMRELAQQFPNANGILERALKQAARELLLAEASDWAFIIKTGTVVEYARKRVKEHVLRFLRLDDEINRGTVDAGFLEDLERKDNIFPAIDYRVWGE